MICADFKWFMSCEARAAQLYRDPRAWARCSVLNIAGASRFSSDDTIRAYAAEIWKIEPVKVDVRLMGEADGT
jgi:glycogen phosphorylase